MRLSLLSKIFGGFFLIILVFAFLILLFTFSAVKSFHINTLAQNLEKLGRSLESKILPYLETEKYKELDSFVKNFGHQINTRITVVDKAGMVLADSDEDPGLMNNHRFRPEISQAFGGKIGKAIRFSNTVKQDMMYVGIPIVREGEISEVLRVSLYVKDINQLRADLRTRIGLLILFVAAISLGGALLLSRSISKPIQKLRDASNKVASGDFDTKVFLKNRDELNDLAQSFNEMTERINSLFSKLSQKKEELSSILYSIEEGLIAIDRNDKIVLSNESLSRIIQSDQLDGKFYWEILRDPKFSDIIKRVKEDRKNHAEELELNGKIFLCSVIFLEPREEIVITLHDLTHIKEVEQIKRDFILNASHELRTPLTAIKGFVETLELEGDVEEKSRYYLDIIKRNTDRLINIVNDLLVISELEEKETQLEIEEVDLNALIKNVLKIFKQKFEKKQIKLEFDTRNDRNPILGDAYKLEQMFINIIDNAEKYTEKGTVRVSLERQKNHVCIKIEDTGIGIPEEHLSRIFERFYVVDKSRSRLLGGTGLGLSIVKHIVLLHRGEASVVSEVGRGTKFTVVLPVS
ncbi:MAG: ATP-binding protein [Candidatus Aminicenantes bacterium]|jgi:two-component system phosphate regulon sensor histidine kinase PhoR